MNHRKSGQSPPESSWQTARGIRLVGGTPKDPIGPQMLRQGECRWHRRGSCGVRVDGISSKRVYRKECMDLPSPRWMGKGHGTRVGSGGLPWVLGSSLCYRISVRRTEGMIAPLLRCVKQMYGFGGHMRRVGRCGPPRVRGGVMVNVEVSGETCTAPPKIPHCHSE